MYSSVTEYIRERITISDEELESSFTYFQPKTFIKGEYLLHAGQYCRFVGFLNKGLIMTTIADQTGNTKATNFIYEGHYFTYTEGLHLNVPSHKNFIALEDCEALMLNKKDLEVIFKETPKYETLLNIILAEEIRRLMLNEQADKTMSLKERYLNIEQQYPNAFQKIPLKYLADYLGIEAPSLSRLRKRLAAK
ncbi:MAG: Crp/Fnr family transcriptional regulator [Mucilaginibacter sp.]|uniref:Crp/Fnr family transcriptional regulator n=1 Tax=Mucilaginibacter sp. TaxID=1882438 RepID=UPI0031ABD658